MRDVHYPVFTFMAAAPLAARPDTPLLQLLERRQGNKLYKDKHCTEALQHYHTALSMLQPITGRPEQEQQEVDANLVKTYLNIAAVHVQQHLYKEATHWCTKALKRDAGNAKAMVRRAKAHLGRHNYQVCQALLTCTQQCGVLHTSLLQNVLVCRPQCCLSSRQSILPHTLLKLLLSSTQDAILDLSSVIQQDPANLDAHELMHKARDGEYAERRST